MKRCQRVSITVVAVAAMALAGCKSKQPKSDAGGSKTVGPPPSGNLPEWVMKAGAAFEKDAGKKIYAVGAASGIRNPSLLRRNSDNNGRVELAKILQTHVTSLAKSYARSVGNMKSSEEEQLVQEASKSYTKADLSGVSIIDHFYDIPTRTMYALAVLDIEAFKELTSHAKKLNEDVKNYILKNAEDAFKELDATK